MPTRKIQPIKRKFANYIASRTARRFGDSPTYRRPDREPWFLQLELTTESDGMRSVGLGHGAAMINEVWLDPWDRQQNWNWFDSSLVLSPGGRSFDFPKPFVDVPGQCKYCLTDLLQENHELSIGRSRSGVKRNAASVVYCTVCGWWKLTKCRGVRDVGWVDWGTISANHYIFEGVLTEFSIDDDALAKRKLCSEIVKRKIDLRDVSPAKLEEVVGAVLSDLYGCDVCHVGGPGDGGIDLLLGVGPKAIAVQVKRRSSERAVESVSLVRHFLGALILGELSRGMVVSTARDYSRPAKVAASEAAKIAAVEIDLYNFSRLIELLELREIPDRPWFRFLSAPSPLERLSLKVEAVNWNWKRALSKVAAGRDHSG